METEIKEEYLGGYRKDYMKHDMVAMNIACICAKESKDPSTQVGACITSSDDRVISTGFNHNPVEWNEDFFPWGNDAKTIGEENTKYPYIIHAEVDAISKCSNKNEIKDGTLYVTLFPCINCAKQIILHEIKKVVYTEYRDTLDARCSKRLLEKCGVEIVNINEIEKTDVKKIKLKLKQKGEI